MEEQDIKRVVKEAIAEWMENFGVDISTAEGRRALAADFNHVRQQRIGAEKIAEWIKKTLITAILGGALWALWEGFKLFIRIKL